MTKENSERKSIDLTRRDFLKKAGIGTAALGTGALIGDRISNEIINSEFSRKTNPTGNAHNASGLEFNGGDVAVEQRDGYEIWIPSSDNVHADLSDGTVISNVLVDQERGGKLAFRTRGTSNWEIRNVGFKGVGKDPNDGGLGFHFKVEVRDSNATGIIENVWVTGWGTFLGGAWTRPGHSGDLYIRNSYFAGFGNNSIYGSNHAEEGKGAPMGDDGRIFIENCYSRNSTTGNFRVGGYRDGGMSEVKNCLCVINDPNCRRGSYSDGSKNARPIWARHARARAKNCVVYVSPDDCGDIAQGGTNGAYQATSGGTLQVENCHVNSACSGADNCDPISGDVEGSLGNDIFMPLKECGVPTSPEMAAQGMRQIPAVAEIGNTGTSPVEASNCGNNSNPSPSPTPELQTITLSGGTSSSPINYEIEASSGITMESGSERHATFGNLATGSLKGGSVIYQVEGKLTGFNSDSGINIQVNGNSMTKQELLNNYLSCQN